MDAQIKGKEEECAGGTKHIQILLLPQPRRIFYVEKFREEAIKMMCLHGGS